jgi:hypothetical protein
MTGMADDDVDEVEVRGIDAETRRVAAAAVAGSAVGWWPAFTLGVYHVIFFEQHLALWVAATAAFLGAGLAGGRKVWRRPAIWALLLPSLWLVLVWILPVGGGSGIYEVLFWFGVVITVLGMPLLALFLVRLLIPHAERLRGRDAVIVSSVVLFVMLASYGVGTQHPRMINCHDFTISGNFAPENCTPDPESTGK